MTWQNLLLPAAWILSLALIFWQPHGLDPVSYYEIKRMERKSTIAYRKAAAKFEADALDRELDDHDCAFDLRTGRRIL